ncbi:Peptidase E [Bordetella sputigena]|uniref:dipeptidase PepE n=1 Tax=Bordetella sputigena TaxID=1416810 RepID=UPI0039EEC4C3
MSTQLLLFSNSRSADGSYLTHAVEPLRALAGERRKTLFVPFAGVTTNWDDYTANVANGLAGLGLEITGAHTVDADAAGRFDLILVGGGNTFQLVAECRRRGWLQAIPERVRAGTPYSGWSAGANLACPTLCTTNDMPIVDPGGFDALGLIGFQINPHYNNALPPGHQGETRNDRIAEFLVANPRVTVVGLPEGDWLAGDGARMTFHGPHTGYVFRQGKAPEALREGMTIG